MRPSLCLGCAVGVPRYPTLDAPVTHGHTPTPPSIGCGSVPGHQSTTSGASVTNTSCQYPVCGPLAVLDIGAVIAGRPSDRGPRSDASAAAPLTHSGHCAALRCRTLQIHRHSLVGARHCGDARKWHCVMPVALLHEDASMLCSGYVAALMLVTRLLAHQAVCLRCDSMRPPSPSVVSAVFYESVVFPAPSPQSSITVCCLAVCLQVPLAVSTISESSAREK
jgi:hypothetical protein